MKRLNNQGRLIISAGALAGYNTIPKLAKAAGIPYVTLYKDLTGTFEGMTAGRLQAIIRTTHMKDEQIIQLIKG